MVATGDPQLPIGSDWVVPGLLLFFGVLLFAQLWPLVMTLRGQFGKARHPVNRMYCCFAAVGILGTVGVSLVVLTKGTREMLLMLAGPTMFLGIVGSAVLAFFAAPWKDWTYREEHKDGRARR